MSKWIAEEEFRCLPRKGKAFTVTVRIGAPELVPGKKKLAAYSRGAVSLEPLVPERAVGAETAFQGALLVDRLRSHHPEGVRRRGRQGLLASDGESGRSRQSLVLPAPESEGTPQQVKNSRAAVPEGPAHISCSRRFELSAAQIP